MKKTLSNLDNLIKIKQLKVEPPDRAEFEGLIKSGKRRLQDSRLKGLSEDGRFSMPYGAAHALALSALRWHGYRSNNRFLVFQCLQHTVGLGNDKWRVLDKCHKQRNLAEYEGHLEITSKLLQEMIDITEKLLKLVEGLGPVKKDE